MTTITKHHSKHLAYSKAYIFVFTAYLDMLKTKKTHPMQKFGNMSEVCWLEDADAGGRVIAVNVYSVDRFSCVYTQMTYVDPEYRGQGLAAQVYSHLEAIVSKRLGPELKAIYTDTVDDNDSMKRVLEKTGREVYTVRSGKFFNGTKLGE
jgi:GNAT superfamily N-acetyltransferase